MIEHAPQPPHTEDYLFNPGVVFGCDVLTADERHTFLRRSLSPHVAAIFEQPIYADGSHYVQDGCGPRSLGTVQLNRSPEVLFQAEPGDTIKPRLLFEDATGTHYRLAVTDLAWRYYADYLQRMEKLTAPALSLRLQAALHGKEVFLRIGLARGWSRHPDRCYLQITGIHTFPDYLGGRTFADFALEPEEDDW